MSPSRASCRGIAVAVELAFEMALAPGEIQLLNNHVIYHARIAFENGAASGSGSPCPIAALPGDP